MNRKLLLMISFLVMAVSGVLSYLFTKSIVCSLLIGFVIGESFDVIIYLLFKDKIKQILFNR
jgi:uncharacterized membrane protein (UPF0136 family)